MRLYVDLETLKLIEAPGFRNPVSALHFKRGDAAQLEVVFLENGTTAVEIGDPGTLELQFGIKPQGRYDVDYLVHEPAWTLPVQGAPDPVYLCAPSFNTVELDSALQVGSSAGTELSQITLMGEITWREGVGEPTSTRTFPVVVENDVNRGTEGVPQDATPAYPLPSAIVTTAAQTFADPQKAQARANIDAFPGRLVGTAYLGGDLSGNTRGSGAIDIQSGRINPTEVASGDDAVALGYSAAAGPSAVAIGDTPAASGTNAIAIGSDSESLGQSGIGIGNVARSLADYSVAIGSNVTVYNAYCVAIGENASASADHSVTLGTYAGSTGLYGTAIGHSGYCGNSYGIAVGYSAYVYGESGVAIGANSGVDSTESVAIGPNVKVGTANVAELGSWPSTTIRDGAVRIHGGTGMIATTIAQASSPYGADSNSTGSEIDGNLASGMTALRIHPTNKTLHIDWNDAGTIRTINLGLFTP